MKKTTLPPTEETSGAPSRRPASACAEAAPVVPYDAPAPGTSLRTRFRLCLEVEETVPYEDFPPIRDTRDALRFLWETLFAREPREVVAVVFVDCRNRPIGHQIASTGTLSRCIAEPRHILASALLANAAGVLVAHNHPSGDIRPSDEDIFFTRRLADAGEVVGVQLVDSLILGRDGDGFRFFSILRRRAARISPHQLTPGAHPAPRIPKGEKS